MTEKTRAAIVVTGATGGVGRALIELAARDDVDLYLVGNVGASKLESELRARDDAPALADAVVLRSDFSLPDAATTLADALLELARRRQSRAIPRFDALVNAAGIDLMTPRNKALAFDARLSRAWQIDVAAPVALSRALGNAMRAFRKTGDAPPNWIPSILFFGWSGSDRGMKGDTAQIYAACKGAIAAFARSLACALAPDVRVNALAPGWIKTTWGATAAPPFAERAAEQALLNRWGTPEEVARVARFLISDDASFINNQTLAIDGGFASRSFS